MTLAYDRLPEDLKWSSNWCLAGPDANGHYKAPHALGPKGIFKASPTDSKHWQDFETTREHAEHAAPCGIGFVLTDKDGYTCIDLDVKNPINYPNKVDSIGRPIEWTTPEQLERFHKIIDYFDSYTERSASGQGFHIWIQGTIAGGLGIKRDGVEIYCQERFIVCTGDVYLDRPIEKRQDALDLLVMEIRQQESGKRKLVELVEIPPVEEDDVIFQRAARAENADKFIQLCNGHWENDIYPSHSEANLALMSIFTFYSKSNEQCRRMFRATKLDLRHKTNKNNYHLDRILRIIRTRQADEVDLEAFGEEAAKSLLTALRTNTHTLPPTGTDAHAVAPLQQAASTIAAGLLGTPTDTPSNGSNPHSNGVLDIALPETLKGMSPTDDPDEVLDDKLPIDWPPGFTGEIARYIFNSAPRQVKEIAIVAALGLVAGLNGKSYHIPQSGLNLYIVLVARSAIGKEAMHSGISNIVKFMLDSGTTIGNYVDFSDYASGPALSKAVSMNHCFVNVSGEWGRKLKRLACEDGRDGPMQQLRTVMTNLYQKSGPNSIVGGIGYSDKEKNVASVNGAAYSMIGETTPDTFYQSLTQQMMEDGFMSRFIVVEYNGERPPANLNAVLFPGTDFKLKMESILQQTQRVNSNSTSVLVERNEEAKKLLDDFDKECDQQINSTTDESWRQMWNRAHLKAYRIAALLASVEHLEFPTINGEQARWALNLIRKDINMMRRRMSAGDVGDGDSSREKKMLSIIKKYLENPVAPSYGVPAKMPGQAIIPRKYLQICTQRAATFTGHRMGHNAILDATIRSLVDSGYLQEYPKAAAVEHYGFHGKCYRVITLPLDGRY